MAAGRKSRAPRARRRRTRSRAGSTRRGSTPVRSRRTSTPLACPIPISSFAPAANSASRISSCGRRPTPNSCSCRSTGRISTARRWKPPSASTAAASAASAASPGARDPDLVAARELARPAGKRARRRANELPLRIYSSIVLGALALAATWIGGTVFALFWLAAAIGVLWEWLRITSLRPLWGEELEPIDPGARRADGSLRLAGGGGGRGATLGARTGGNECPRRRIAGVVKAQTNGAKVAVSIFGATGSVGENALDLIRRAPERYEIVALTAHRDGRKLAALAREHGAKLAVLAEPE